jgi:3-polyprenyl-4-hydroxybenzoate decarboxylase
MFNARIFDVINHGYNWNVGDVLYSELETVLHRAVSLVVAIYCFGHQKTNFISSLIERTVIDITQLSCPELADISLPTISCTFACHNKSKYVCALRAAYSLVSGSTFTFLVCSM